MRQGTGRAACCGVLAFLPLVAGCGGEDLAQPPPTPVRVQVAALAAPSDGLRYSASVDPYTQVSVDFDVEGYVAEIRQLPGADGRMRDLQPGDVVEQDSFLARIAEDEHRNRLEEARARLAKAEASLRKSRADFDRDAKLFATQSITAPEYDRARKDYESARASVAENRAQLDQAQLRLEACTLEAPMAGVILDRGIETGSLVRIGTTAFVIGDVSSVKVVFGVPDVMLAGLELGAPLAFETASAHGRVFEGLVTAISPAADATTRVFEVEITVSNEDGALRPGMIASLDVGAAGKSISVLAVPVGAVLRSPRNPDGYAVAVVEGDAETGVARLRDVELGDPVGDQVIVISGLQPGERVIVSGATRVADGASVRVVP